MKIKIIHLAPRVLSLIFIGFISLFSLDVFGQYQGLSLLIALFMHLLPSLGLLIFVAIAWRYGLVGVAGFIGFAIYYAFTAKEHPTWILIIAVPALFVGFLYFWDWKISRKSK